jgi:hypothetical protein
MTPGINGVSAPVFGHTGRMVAARLLGIIGSFDLELGQPDGAGTREAAATLSRRLGYGSSDGAAGEQATAAASALRRKSVADVCRFRLPCRLWRLLHRPFDHHADARPCAGQAGRRALRQSDARPALSLVGARPSDRRSAPACSRRTKCAVTGPATGDRLAVGAGAGNPTVSARMRLFVESLHVDLLLLLKALILGIVEGSPSFCRSRRPAT